MIKILYLTQFPEIGGGETILLSLLEKLDRKLFKPIVIVPQNGQLSDRLKKLNVETHILALPPYLWRTFFMPGLSPTNIYKFYQLTKKIKPNLIHLNHLTLSVYAGTAAKLLKIPLVATAHGPWDSYYFYQDLITGLFVDKILANTPDTAQTLLKRKIIQPVKVEVVPFGVDTNKFKPATYNQKLVARKTFGISANEFVITIVGRLDPSKDHLTFLKAANLLLRKIKNAKFLIVGSKLGDFSGSNYWQQISQFLQNKPNLAKKTTFGGFIDDMPSVYNATDVMVSTSPSESFGLSILEAAACDLPIVATNTNRAQSLVKNNISGYLVPPKNPQLIAKRIERLFKSPTTRINFGKSARSYIQKEFPLAKYLGKIEFLYFEQARTTASSRG